MILAIDTTALRPPTGADRTAALSESAYVETVERPTHSFEQIVVSNWAAVAKVVPTSVKRSAPIQLRVFNGTMGVLTAFFLFQFVATFFGRNAIHPLISLVAMTSTFGLFKVFRRVEKIALVKLHG